MVFLMDNLIFIFGKTYYILHCKNMIDCRSFYLALFPGFFLNKVLDENKYIEPEPEPNFEITKDVKTSITVMNTLENIINEHDYLMDPNEDSEMVTLDEDLGSGSGDNPMDNKKMTGIDPGLLESSNNAVIVNNDVELIRFSSS